MSGSRQQHTPDRGDIVFTNFSPQSGSEMAGDHPSLVLSTARFSVSTGCALVGPNVGRPRRHDNVKSTMMKIC
jgi:mRNA-degrading endonuclease toxin of MazEF toxin-antitoxin module